MTIHPYISHVGYSIFWKNTCIRIPRYSILVYAYVNNNNCDTRILFLEKIGLRTHFSVFYFSVRAYILEYWPPVDSQGIRMKLHGRSASQPRRCELTGFVLQGEPKNVPTRKLRYIRNAWIFLYQILSICLQDNCGKVCCFVLYLLGTRQIDGNEFCNCTEGWRYKSRLDLSLIQRLVPHLLRRQCDFIILFQFRMLINVLIF